MVILGAVVVDDRYMCYHLTDFMYLGSSFMHLEDRVRRTAKVLRVLKSCLLELEIFYTNLLPSVCHALSQPEESSIELPSSSNTLSSLYGKHLHRQLVHGYMRPHNIVPDVGHGGKQDTVDFDWMDKFGSWSFSSELFLLTCA
jgi:hypothetical protein